MSRFLTELEQEIQATARRFAQKEIRPRRLEAYKNEGYEKVYRDITKGVGQLGLMGTLIPEQFGGAGMTPTTACVILEELGREHPGLAVSTLVTMTMLSQMLMLLEPQVANRYLPGILSGDLVMAGGASDPAGIVNYAEQPDIAAADGDDFALNGTRLWVTNGTIYDVMWIMGLYKGSQYGFLVEKGHPGITVKPMHKMGFGSPWGIITLNNCRVSRNMAVDLSAWVKDRQLQDLTGKTTPALVYISAIALGAADRVFEITMDYMRIRTNNKKPLASMQAIQHKMAKIKTHIEAARSLLYDSARLRDQGRVDGALDHMVKAFVPNVAVDAIQECMTLHGGTGYAVETGIEGYLRDAMGILIGDCTAEMHYSSIASIWGMPDSRPGAF